MANICILGIKGAGKTVFISVLAHRFREVREGRPRMVFKNAKTNNYVSEVWEKLTRERKWPDSTEQGERPELSWTLYAADGREYDLTALDAPGQDVDAVFSGLVELSPKQRGLETRVRNAETVVFLVDLLELANSGETERADRESPIALALKTLLGRGTRVAVLLSKHDLLKRRIAREKGRLEIDFVGVEHELSKEASLMSPMEALGRWLPAVYAELKDALERRDPRVYVNFVSAVADTEEPDPGKKIPRENFGSYGLDEAMEWMTGSLADAARERLSAWRREELARASGRALAVALLPAALAVACAAGWQFVPGRVAESEKRAATEEWRAEEKRVDEWKKELGTTYDERAAEIRGESANTSTENQIREKLETYQKERKPLAEELEMLHQTLEKPEYKVIELGGWKKNKKDKESKETEWEWEIDRKWFKKDDVIVRNLSEKDWRNPTVTIRPVVNKSDSVTTTTMSIAAGDEWRMPEVVEFDGEDGEALLTVEVRDYDKENAKKTKFRKKTNEQEELKKRFQEERERIEASGDVKAKAFEAERRRRLEALEQERRTELEKADGSLNDAAEKRDARIAEAEKQGDSWRQGFFVALRAFAAATVLCLLWIPWTLLRVFMKKRVPKPLGNRRGK